MIAFETSSDSLSFTWSDAVPRTRSVSLSKVPERLYEGRAPLPVFEINVHKRSTDGSTFKNNSDYLVEQISCKNTLFQSFES